MAKQYFLEHNSQVGSWPGELPVNNLYTAGAAGQKAWSALKAEGKILASKPAGADVKFLPARLFCEQTFAKLDEYVEVTGPGTLHTWTVARVDKDGNHYDEPFTIGFVTWDGVKGGLFGRILGEPAIGAKVEPVFKPADQREGNVGDIEGFKVL